jgi:hypothetical protein
MLEKREKLEKKKKKFKEGHIILGDRSIILKE